ncbi:MAG: hypothetical protein BWK78_05500, partial [Thiotrichaceae bacterium IS1]
RLFQGKTVKSVNALVYFRESHGGFQSCFSLKNLTTGKTTDLFYEVKYSDKNMRGDNDWLGSVEGGILGSVPAVQTIELAPGNDYTMLIWGYKWPHKQDAHAAKTNFNDPVPDANPHLFTFYENASVEPPKKKSLSFLNPQGPSISTIIGFEDGYKQEEKPDYNDIIIEMCLRVDY